MNFSNLLLYHSYFRWVVLVVLVFEFCWIWYNKRSGSIFEKRDFLILIACTLLFNIQLLLGWLLYFNSAIVDSFWNNLSIGLKQRQVRFFGLEHMTMMSLAILLLNYITFKCYYLVDKSKTFSFLFRNFIWVVLIILSSVPWSFSPLTSRPNFR